MSCTHVPCLSNPLPRLVEVIMSMCNPSMNGHGLPTYHLQCRLLQPLHTICQAKKSPLVPLYTYAINAKGTNGLPTYSLDATHRTQSTHSQMLSPPPPWSGTGISHESLDGIHNAAMAVYSVPMWHTRPKHEPSPKIHGLCPAPLRQSVPILHMGALYKGTDRIP